MHVCTALALNSMYIVSFRGAGMVRWDGMEMCCVAWVRSARPALQLTHLPGILAYWRVWNRDVGSYIYVVMTVLRDGFDGHVFVILCLI
jgi:hypothetical protein